MGKDNLLGGDFVPDELKGLTVDEAKKRVQEDYNKWFFERPETKALIEKMTKQNISFVPNPMFDDKKINVVLLNDQYKLDVPEEDRGLMSYTHWLEERLMEERKSNQKLDPEPFEVVGLLRGEVQRSASYKRSSSVPNTFRGYALDEIGLTAMIRSEQDVDNLIDFLRASRGCFDHSKISKP